MLQLCRLSLDPATATMLQLYYNSVGYRYNATTLSAIARPGYRYDATTLSLQI
jgi:hypothetical protein